MTVSNSASSLKKAISEIQEFYHETMLEMFLFIFSVPGQTLAILVLVLENIAQCQGHRHHVPLQEISKKTILNGLSGICFANFMNISKEQISIMETYGIIRTKATRFF